MLKLVQCEFAKLKRKKIIPLVFLSAFLFPIPITFLMATPRMLEKYPNKSVLFDGLFNMVMGYGVIFLLPCIIGVIAAMLFFMERDNDTFKNLRTIPVTSTQMIMAKIIVLFIFGVIFCLASMLATIEKLPQTMVASMEARQKITPKINSTMIFAIIICGLFQQNIHLLHSAMCVLQCSEPYRRNIVRNIA